MILLGDVLTVALRRTKKPIELRDANNARIDLRDDVGERIVLTATDLTRYLDAGYEAHGDKHRVRYVKPAPPVIPVRPEMPWLPCWRTVDAAVIAWHGSQFSPGIRGLDAPA